jgi:general stress protein 26
MPQLFRRFLTVLGKIFHGLLGRPKPGLPKNFMVSVLNFLPDKLNFMKSEQYLPFLQQKIQGIGSALFYSLSDAVLKFPTSIVNTLKVDETGNVWFLTNRPGQHLHEFDWEFPARMQFYRKGKGYFLQINGKACIVNDPEEVNNIVALPEETKNRAFKEMVLIRVQIGNVEYCEYKDKKVIPNNKLQGWFLKLYNWFFTETEKTETYILSPNLAMH